MAIAENPAVRSTAARDEHDDPSFPGGLSRRQIDQLRRVWMHAIGGRGGWRFDRLDGFLTVCALLPQAPARADWLPSLLGPVVGEPPAGIQDWLDLLEDHVRRRVALDLDRHGPAALPEFDFLPIDDSESEEEAERRSAQSWSEGACAALALAPTVMAQIEATPALREPLAPIVLLGMVDNDQGERLDARARRRLMGAAAVAAHRLWKHFHDSSAVPRAGRNEPCPCGSGRKYKHCHGRAG